MKKFFPFIFTLSLVLGITSIHAADLKQIEQGISDSVITTKITAKLTKHKQLNPLKISVTTTDGVVKLSGFVKDRAAFVEALRLAKTTNGVKKVNVEKLTIKEVNTAITDAYITAKVETAVLKAKVFEDESIPLAGIHASTVNGIVTLSGDLKSLNSAKIIVARVKALNGVKKVISHLHVES